MTDVAAWLRLFREGMVRALDRDRAREERVLLSSSEGPLPSNEEEYSAIDKRNRRYLELLQEESHAARVYYALVSQGRYCPTDKLEEARRYMKLTEKLTRNYIEFMKEEAAKNIVDRSRRSA